MEFRQEAFFSVNIRRTFSAHFLYENNSFHVQSHRLFFDWMYNIQSYPIYQTPVLFASTTKHDIIRRCALLRIQQRINVFHIEMPSLIPRHSIPWNNWVWEGELRLIMTCKIIPYNFKMNLNLFFKGVQLSSKVEYRRFSNYTLHTVPALNSLKMNKFVENERSGRRSALFPFQCYKSSDRSDSEAKLGARHRSDAGYRILQRKTVEELWTHLVQVSVIYCYSTLYLATSSKIHNDQILQDSSEHS